jgi:hypothetical protein
MPILADAFVALHAEGAELAPEIEAQATSAAAGAEAALAEGIATGVSTGVAEGGAALAELGAEGAAAGVEAGDAIASGVAAGGAEGGAAGGAAMVEEFDASVVAAIAAWAGAFATGGAEAGAAGGAAAGTAFTETFTTAASGALAAGSFSKLLGPLIGAAVVVKTLGTLVTASREAGAAQRQLQQSLLSSPAAADVSIAAYNKQADALQNLTGFRNDDIVQVQAQLALYGLTGEQVQKLTPLVLDFAARTGRDVPAAGAVVSKALLGMGRALKEVGIRFTDTKTLAGNFDEIMQGLGGSVKGFAASQLATLGGQLRLLHSNFNDLAQEGGDTLIPILAAMAKEANVVVGSFKAAGDSSEQVTAGQRGAATSGNLLAQVWGILSATSNILKGNVDETKAAIADATVTVGEQAKALNENKISVDQFRESFHAAADAVKAEGGSTADYHAILNEGRSAIHDYLFNLTGLTTQREIDTQAAINEQVATAALAGGFAAIAADIVNEANAHDALAKAQAKVNRLTEAGKINTQKGIEAQRALTLAEAQAIQSHESTVKSLGDLVLSQQKVKAAMADGTLTTRQLIGVFQDQAKAANLSKAQTLDLQDSVLRYIRTQDELHSPPILQFREQGLDEIINKANALTSALRAAHLSASAAFSFIPPGTTIAPPHPGGGGGGSGGGSGSGGSSGGHQPPTGRSAPDLGTSSTTVTTVDGREISRSVMWHQRRMAER